MSRGSKENPYLFKMMEPYVGFIKSGKKKIEGRVNSPKFRVLKEGNYISLCSPKEAIVCRVLFLHPYPTFRAMLQGEDFSALLPQFEDSGLSAAEKLEEGIKVYESFPKAERAKIFGVVAIGIEYISEGKDEIANP